MFWSNSASGTREKQRSLTVFYEPEEDQPGIVTDFANYPFTITAKVGNASMSLHLSYGMANQLAFQLNAQLQEADRLRIERGVDSEDKN